MSGNTEKLELLQTKIQEIDALKNRHDESKLVQWQTEVKIILESLIGDQSKYYQQFTEIDYLPHYWNDENRSEQVYKAYSKGLDEAKGILNGIIYGVEKGLI